MINIFKKKPKECAHKYKDFPWYVIPIQHPTGLLYDVKIMEPYVCLLCKKRVDKELGVVKDVLRTNVQEEMEELKEQYKSKIKDVVIVEDMINDFQLVDRSFIESYEYSQKITENIMKSMYEDKPTSNDSNNKDLSALISEVKNNLQVTQKGN